MRHDTVSQKAPDLEAVELGPDNIFAQMGEPYAEERLLKVTLVSRLRAAISDRKLTQIKAGEILGIPQPKVSELVSGAASGFSAERLIHLLNKVGVSVSVAFREEPNWKPGTTFVHFDREPDTDMVAAERDHEADQEAAIDLDEVLAGPSMG